MINIKKISKQIYEKIIKMAGWNVSNTGWLKTNGELFKLKRGETHYEAAVRYIKENDPQYKKIIKMLKQTIDDGTGIIDYNKLYEYMCNQYNLIRVSEDGFDTKMNENNMNRISKFIKENFQGQMYMSFHISNIDDIYDTTAITMETITEEEYNIPRALYKTKQRNRMIGI